MFLYPLSDLTDDGRFAAVRIGRDEAWAELLRHHPPLLRYLTAAVGDPEQPAQLAHETFVDAVRALDQLAPGRPFAPWLYRIAYHNLLPYWRRRARVRFTPRARRSPARNPPGHRSEFP